MGEDQALQQLHDILAAAEFQPTAVSLWERLQQAIGDTIYNAAVGLWHSVADAASGREGPLGWLGLLVTGTLVVTGVVFLVRAARLALVPAAGLAAPGRDERRRRSDQLWQQAQQLSGAGRFAEAARAAYLSALYALDEHALLRVQVGLTNHEHALQIQHPDLGVTFASLVRRYDRLRYGNYPVDAASFGELSLLVAQARAAAA